MEKELKSCTGVLLRADLTGHGHSSPFCQNGWDGRALLGQPSKGHPCRILILFPYCSTTSLAPHIKKLETYFALLYFWTFTQCSVTSLEECLQTKRLDMVLTLKTIFLLSFCLDLSSLISLRNQSYFGYHLDTALFNLLTLTERGHKFCKKSIFTCWSFELFFSLGAL